MPKTAIAVGCAKGWDPAASKPQERTYEYGESLPIALVKAREAIMPLFRASQRKRGLTELQWRVLLAVRSAGEIEVARLAQMAFLLPPSLSRILKELTARGFLGRRPAPEDQRSWLVSLSPQGEELMREVFPDILAGYDEIRRRYGPERLQALQAMLTELWEALRDPSLVADTAENGETDR